MPKINKVDSGNIEAIVPRAPNIVAVLVFFACAGTGVVLALLWREGPLRAIIGIVIGLLLALSPKVAKQWERAIVLRLGRYVGQRGPGLFWILPGIDQVSAWIDQRIITTSFAAEQTLT